MSSSYDERLSAPPLLWLVPLGTGVSAGLILFVFGPVLGLLGLVGGTALAAVVLSSYGSPRIRVVNGHLVAGEAKLPLEALGEAHVMDKEEAFLWRTRKADARAFMLLRGYIPTALRVDVTDPQDPTPYLYLSTRHPESLADAIREGRALQGGGQGREQPATHGG
ncbi:DUF3093 domain-containing protein [Streptacidiphilus monticola]|jgi:hypothetical protein|uniref:DUF3093 domain-containing protein n=1 Tax=Streptacidiphilus monticola TaxID=2161674 RepID=A0ABW1G935_9ACTN